MQGTQSVKGVCSHYLSKLQGNFVFFCVHLSLVEHDYLLVSFSRGNMREPTLPSLRDVSKPLSIVALGAGIGGVIPILEQRELQKKRNQPVGPLYLFFGCRQSTKDFLLKEKINRYVTSGVITQLFTAFSHDQPERIYTDHRLRENPGIIWNTLSYGNFHYSG